MNTLLPINPREFLVEIPPLHPKSSSYISFWREQKRRCIEGYWVGGRYMPPTLYFYVNFATIRKNKKHSPNIKHFARPTLRDLEWYTFYAYTVARGFSGFMYDDVYTCNKAVLSLSPEELKEEFPDTISSSGNPKLYKDPLEYISASHPSSLGPALFHNPCYNLLMLGSRDTGKSYMVGAGMVLHNFLFDGATVYDENSILNPSPIETIVGAENSKYSSDLLKKTKESLDNLPGKITHLQDVFPSPFSKQFVGSWSPGSEIIAAYKKRFEGQWIEAGSKSSIKHRTFSDNPFAAQGTRPSLLVIEESGHCGNLLDIYENTVDNLRSGLWQTGTLMMLGTGGDMEKGTIPASQMFYEPEKYNILPFEDHWEHRGKIGYFIPAYLSLNQYKDEWGFTKLEAATKALQDTRKEKKSTKSSDVLNKEIQYRPLVPSEMFLSRGSNIFPTLELRNRLTQVQSLNLFEEASVVQLYFDASSPLNGVSYELDFSSTPITTFPYDSPDKEGAIVIYEFPKTEDSKVPPGLYVIGCDPYKDDTPDGPSLAAIYVVKTSKYFASHGFNEIVASYIGRPYMGKNVVNEILHKLALFYNAKIYFENSVGNVKDYFEKVKRLDLLASQPLTVFNKKASYDTRPSFTYGYPMSNQKVKWEALQYLRTFLLEERDPSTQLRNLDMIKDPGLLSELISFSLQGNFDRVMGLVGAIIGLEEIHNLNKNRALKEESLSSLQQELKNFITNNKALFRHENFSSTKVTIFGKS